MAALSIEQDLPEPAPTSSHQRTYVAAIAPRDLHSLALIQASRRLFRGKRMHERDFIRKIYSGQVIVWCNWNVLENGVILRNYMCILQEWRQNRLDLQLPQKWKVKAILKKTKHKATTTKHNTLPCRNVLHLWLFIYLMHFLLHLEQSVL